jgi:hypothetical protein
LKQNNLIFITIKRLVRLLLELLLLFAIIFEMVRKRILMIKESHVLTTTNQDFIQLEKQRQPIVDNLRPR